MPWKRKWQLSPVFLPGKSRGERSLACDRPGGQKGLDMTEPHARTCSSMPRGPSVLRLGPGVFLELCALLLIFPALCPSLLVSCRPPDGCGSQISGHRDVWAPGLPLCPNALAGSASPSALDFGMSVSLAVAPTTILGRFTGPTWSQWEET